MKKLLILILLLTACTPITPIPTPPQSLLAVTSIQSLINSASAGSTVRINSGTYDERITINKSLTLICTGECVTKGIDITASNVRLENMTAKNGLQRGLSVIANNVEIINITIDGVLCDPSIVCETDYFRVHGNNVNFHGGKMVGITENISPSHSDGGQNFGSRGAWTNSEFEGVYMEIVCGRWEGTSFAKCQGFQIEGDPSSASRTPSNLKIHNNHIVSTRTINIGDSDDAGTTNNIKIYNNIIEGRIPRPSGSGLQYGCFVTKGSSITLTNNYIHNIDGSWNNGCSASGNYLWNDNNRTFSPSLSGTNVKRQLSAADLCALGIGLPCDVATVVPQPATLTPTRIPAALTPTRTPSASPTATKTNIPPSETPTASPSPSVSPTEVFTATPEPITINGTPFLCPCVIEIP